MQKLWILARVAILSSVSIAAGAQDNPTSPDFYTARVRPIFEQHCATCHLGSNHRAGLSLESRATILQGGHHGPAIVPGEPNSSLLVKLIRQEGLSDEFTPMPPPPHDKLSDADIKTIEDWIKAGAVAPDGAFK